MSRYVDVLFDTKDWSEVENKINEEIKNIDFPLEYYSTILNIQEEKNQYVKNMILVLITISFIIFLLLQLLFNS
jgi:hypothetical protein